LSFICYKSLFKIKKMKVDEKLLNRIREALMYLDNIEEKPMFGGVCFMVNDKMCICARNDRMMCRVGPKKYEVCLEEIG
jgi:TfoX/Sxy family transcriptional regulator of competence genes